VDVDGVTDCDHVMRVPGKGMPRRNGRGFGDLYITFEVDFPETLTQKQKDELRKILGPNAHDEL
jgi:DnaJ-class molecular chaperone